MRLLFYLRRHTDLVGSEGTLCAFVRWYEVALDRLDCPDLACLHWGPGDTEYDVIPAGSIRRPVTLQAHPDAEREGILVHNHFL